MSRDGPEWIVWLVNASCNLRCPYCYASRYLRERPLSTEEALRVVREASDAGVEYINFTGGEPLLRRDLFEIVEAALDGGIEVSIFSNLTLLGEEQARRIARLGLYVLTSLDGPPEVYEAAKGPGTWRRFLRGIELLKKHGVAFHINIPVSELNYARVGEAVKLAAELGASSISVIPAMPTGRALETGAYIRPSSFLEALRQAEEAARELGITVSVWCAPFVASLQWARHLSYGNCRSWSVMDITPGGKVVLCDVLGIEVADVLRDGLLGAWRRLREHPLNAVISKAPSECSACPFAKTCLGGCYARAYIRWGRLPAPDPLCPRVPMARP